MAQEWTIEAVKRKLTEIKQKGFITIPEGMHRTDDGIVGQILEREFDVEENNLPVGDLGTFELKGIRKKSTNLTLSHKKPEKGLSPIKIFERFGYIRHSKRNPEVLKKKFFVTINGEKSNPQGLLLRGIEIDEKDEKDTNTSRLDMVYTGGAEPEFICEWDLSGKLEKMNKVILGIAETTGATNAPDEKFHFTKAFLLEGLKPINQLVKDRVIVVDFCIDQPIDKDHKALKSPHDRGPHIRIAVSKLKKAYDKVIQILPEIEKIK